MLNVAALQGAPVSFDGIHPAVSAASAAQDAYIRAHEFDEPTVIFDLDMLRGKYDALATGLGDASIHYAVKANPAPEVVAALAARGAHFDAASRGEIDLCLDLGVPAGAGGVIFPKLISEGAVGSDGPILQTIDVPTAGWTTYTYSPTITADVTRGITFEISVVCGAVAGCIADVFIDNVSVQIR